jgi:hypothetical protein
MNIEFRKDKIIKVNIAPQITIPLERIINLKLSKGNELRIEMIADNRITPISTGPA